MGEHDEISWNTWSSSSSISCPRSVFHSTVLGSRPTKQLASMGIPALLSWRPSPLLFLYLSSSLCSCPPYLPVASRPSLFSPRWSLWGGGEAPATPPLMYEVRVHEETSEGLSLLRHSVLHRCWYPVALGRVSWVSQPAKCDWGPAHPWMENGASEE